MLIVAAAYFQLLQYTELGPVSYSEVQASTEIEQREEQFDCVAEVAAQANTSRLLVEQACFRLGEMHMD